MYSTYIIEEKLSNLEDSERKIVQYISMCREAMTHSDFLSLLKNAELKNVDGKAYNTQTVLTLREKLLRLNVFKATNTVHGYNGYGIIDTETQEFLIREVFEESWFADAVQTIKNYLPRGNYSQWSTWSNGAYYRRSERDFRLAIYQKNVPEAISLLNDPNNAIDVDLIFREIFLQPFQADFLESFEPQFKESVIISLLNHAMNFGEPTEELWTFVERDGFKNIAFQEINVTQAIFRGALADVKAKTANHETILFLNTAGFVAVLEKDYAKAVTHFEDGIKIWRKSLNKKKGYSADWRLFGYGLALCKTDELKFFSFVEEYWKYANKEFPQKAAPKALLALGHFLKNNDLSAEYAVASIETPDIENKLIKTIISAIIPKVSIKDTFYNDFLIDARLMNYKWVEMEIENLLIQKRKKTGNAVNLLKETLGFEPLGDLFPPIEDWERAIKVLTSIASSLQDQRGDKKIAIDETRLAWLIDFQHSRIQPIEQKYGKNGWSQGRNVSLKRLYENDIKNLTTQDKIAIKSGINYERAYYYGSAEYNIVWDKIMPTLIEHPYLFLQNSPTTAVQLEKGEPSLQIKRVKNALEVSFDLKFGAEGILLHKETATRYKVVQITKQHLEIATTFGNEKLVIPDSGRELLMKAIQSLSSKISINSDLEEHFENLPSIQAERRIHALITPIPNGFHLEFFVKPFATVPPYFKPGKGNESVVVDLNGVRTRAKRNLKQEVKLLNEVEDACPTLAAEESANYEWEFSEVGDCLTAMLEMETPRKADQLIIEWPKGQKLKLLGNIGVENFVMNVKGKGNWFEVSGEAKVDENLVLSMQEITKLISQSNSNFIELTDGQFVSITEKLRKHLQVLNGVLDDKSRLHQLSAGILDEFSSELENFKVDKAWKEHIKKIKDIQNFTPELPTTFEAELRPYQLEGYHWLSRLAQWGVGACLADDMGLGKTVQALAILVERAEKGAALVVAPVSVCRNWLKEATRFAPTLNFQLFGSGDRESAVRNLGVFDVLVVSYSLLQSEEELFKSNIFATILLDEAQAIKNRQTKRSKTVMALQADFRLITTGTPIENHLGELWNLFNFINPSLLGSHDSFNEKFAIPIEKNKDESARRSLQRIIKPFVLRRRKNQVLNDLPAKTEIMLTVEMSPEERAFYENIRREAIQKIESDGGAAPDKRFRILAELTRLRLACCHPQLVNPDIPLGSSKLDLFSEVIDELLENKHKALVFSQFVKHLHLIEENLKSKNIAYHYLDGSTPPTKRQEQIDAFQRGKGDVFLISLKAGGTGLNLTAADYVIHLDPWWNPAVEDQATDRVHRIGQQRPVTVYRLVTENTVEEKILKLHETKRDLADSLLDGTDSSSKLSTDDLLALIREA